jgi:hypothetical protein
VQRNIVRVFEIVGALLAGEEVQELANLSPSGLDIARLGSLAKTCSIGLRSGL